MSASAENPVYTVYLIDGTKKYNITPAITAIDISDQENQIAQSVSLSVMNEKVGGAKIASLIKVRQRVVVYANDGTTKAEVFRGFVWTRYYDESLDEHTIMVKCYDNLIYFQESEDSLYFSKGKNTKAVMQSICNKWGIKLNYSYSTINHDKLVLRGTLSDIFTSDILDKVKDRTGNRYVIGSQKDTMYVKAYGQNTTVYTLSEKKNVVSARIEQTMDGMITKVVILGNAKKGSEKEPVVATVTGNTSKYGTLQRLQDKDEDTSLANAKKEAEVTLKENGAPFWEYEVRSPDIPWIRKGDKVKIKAGGINGTAIVVGIDRTITNQKKEMVLTLKYYTRTASSAGKSNSSTG